MFPLRQCCTYILLELQAPSQTHHTLFFCPFPFPLPFPLPFPFLFPNPIPIKNAPLTMPASPVIPTLPQSSALHVLTPNRPCTLNTSYTLQKYATSTMKHAIWTMFQTLMSVVYRSSTALMKPKFNMPPPRCLRIIECPMSGCGWGMCEERTRDGRKKSMDAPQTQIAGSKYVKKRR
jgi:hypothetical protein